jgi:hypothetical protein
MSVTDWNECPARSSKSSDRCLPTNWKPIGAPRSSTPPFMVRAGIPVKSNGAVKRNTEAMSPFAISSHSAAVGVAAFNTEISSTSISRKTPAT